MPSAAMRTLGRFARPDDATDAELLQRFAADRDGAAFAALVHRHGPMVFGVCRRVLRDWHLAEDAFQAAFVVLARRAAVVRPPSAVAGWLHGVAYRVAKDARRSALRRFNRERPTDMLPEPSAQPVRDDADFQRVLDDELQKLPGKYRQLLVACDLEGRPRLPVAEGLGIPEGTLSSRLTTARKMLAARLTRRGLAPAVVAGIAANGPSIAASEVPRALLASAARIGSAAPGTVPASIAAFSHGVIRAMTLRSYLPWTAGVLVAMSAAIGYAATRNNNPVVDTPGSPRPALALVVNEQPPAKAEAKPLPKGPNRLLVWRKDELVTLDPDGKNEKLALTKMGIHPYMFAMSPDGKKVAFVRPGDGEGNLAHLFVYDVGDKDSGVDLGPAGIALWSAGGTELVICQFGDGPKVEEATSTCEIVTLATKKRTPLKIPADHFIIDWSRDGRSFLTLKPGGEPGGVSINLYVMNRDGSEPKKLTDEKFAMKPGRFSPDGTRVLCARTRPSEETAAEKKARDELGAAPPPPTHELIVIDIATKKVTPVADFPLNAEIQGYCWSPDGKRIAYTWREVHTGNPKDNAEKETNSHLVVCDPDGKNPKELLSETAKGPREHIIGNVDWR